MLIKSGKSLFFKSLFIRLKKLMFIICSIVYHVHVYHDHVLLIAVKININYIISADFITSLYS